MQRKITYLYNFLDLAASNMKWKFSDYVKLQKPTENLLIRVEFETEPSTLFACQVRTILVAMASTVTAMITQSRRGYFGNQATKIVQ